MLNARISAETYNGSFYFNMLKKRNGNAFFQLMCFSPSALPRMQATYRPILYLRSKVCFSAMIVILA